MGRVRVVLLLVLVTGCGPATVVRHSGLPAPVRIETRAEQRAAFAQAYELFRHDQLEPALAIFTALADTYPELADYHLFYAGIIHQRLSHPKRAEAAFGRILREYPQSVHVLPAALTLGQVLQGTGRGDEARVYLQRALAARDTATAQAARLALAELDEPTDATAAYDAFMTVRREAAGTALAKTAKQHVLALREQYPALVPTGADRVNEARLLLSEHDFDAAAALAAQIAETPDGADPGEAARLQAEALFGDGKLEAALKGLWDVARDYPGSPAAPAALARMNAILWNRDRDAAALRGYEEFLARFPDDERAPEAWYAIGRIHQSADRRDAAIAAYTELATRFPHDKLADEARWRIGWIHYRSEQWAAAVAVFARLSERTQDRARDEAMYWQARALEQARNASAARTLYRKVLARDAGSYYAMWAERRLAGSSSAPPRTTADLAEVPPPPTPGPAPIVDSVHLPRAEELRAAGVLPLARRELQTVEYEHSEDTIVLRYLLDVYPTVDGYTAALRLVQRLGGNADLSSTARQRLLYPLAFWTSVRHEADMQGLDPLLVEAVMRQESLFDPAVRSSANAIGLMQLLPATAERVAAVGEVQTSTTDLTDPALNIRLGARYLRALLTQFQADPLKALAAYNGGERAVEKWQRRYGELADDEFVESITYRETRDYVKRVMANYRAYGRLYAGG